MNRLSEAESARSPLCLPASSPIECLSEFLYLPEVLDLVIPVWLLVSGPGWLSVDHFIWTRFTV
jgi:hypothetical protein